MLYKVTGNEHRLDWLEMTWKGMFKRVWIIKLQYNMGAYSLTCRVDPASSAIQER